MALHDRRDPFEVVVELRRGCGRSHGSLKAGEEVGDHRMVLFELAEHVAQLGMFRGDRREQVSVFAFVVRGQGEAEPVAEQKQIVSRPFRRLAVSHGAASHLQGLAQAVVDGTQFAAPGDEPGPFALSHLGRLTPGTSRTDRVNDRAASADRWMPASTDSVAESSRSRDVGEGDRREAGCMFHEIASDRRVPRELERDEVRRRYHGERERDFREAQWLLRALLTGSPR